MPQQDLWHHCDKNTGRDYVCWRAKDRHWKLTVVLHEDFDNIHVEIGYCPFCGLYLRPPKAIA